ncbi:MAG TPA: FAD-dependent oxidoreductase, partial [Myxococcaceae bacterium]|nr:FAD-dependent oxidoreductase [Myxococcaceae bacterium]
MSFPPSEVTAVVGAGVSGLTCARTLRDAGRAVVVLERARGIGGRCATRTLDGQPVDYGPMFLHGRHPGFVAELDALIRAGGDGWPRRVEGRGSACQPEAFTPGERRWAPEAGVFALPRRLAQGLEVRTQTRVTGLARGPDGWMVQTEAEPLLAGRLVLAMAPEQTVGLLETAEAEMPALRGPLALLRTIQSE